MNGSRVLLLGVLLIVPAFAGCANDEPTPSKDPITQGSTTSGTGSPVTNPTPATVAPRGTSERWHFHDYWKGNPTITLFQGNLTFNASTDGTPGLSAIVELPHGVIVPPETGFLTLNVTWDASAGGPGTINLTYKPADSNDYEIAGDVVNGMPFQLNTTESNCDVPHRQASAWKFNLTVTPTLGAIPPALPDGAPGAPPVEAQLVVTATIGRPLFIDPPHLNWWRDGDIIPLVLAGAGEIRAATSPAGNVTLPGGVPSAPTAPPSLASMQQSARVPVDTGRIVPEGTKSIVAILNWTTQMPDAKLSLAFAENNLPSSGALELASESGTSRTYVLKVAQAQTDTTYSNRTTWEFRVLPDGDPAAAFDGTFTLVAWAARLEPKAAAAQIMAPPER